ncbi:phage tail sheath subtilisin-like domain-containing protein [Bradyrhizobium sp. 26S5]|uniref:phage tail sheath family protein n=1 Tax=Bradyrhizobium sp. 26S5 TaxID=3139729 RepID=UPI0030CDAD8C
MDQLVRGAPGLYARGLAPEPSTPSSAVAGFVGISERGPLHQPQPIFSWDEYVSIFGQPLDHAFLSDAVHGFFGNGGKKCFVVRVGDLGAGNGDQNGDHLAAAKRMLKVRDDGSMIEVAAINNGRWGNEIQVSAGAGSQPNFLLTSLVAESIGNKLGLDSTLDLIEGMKINLVPPGNPFGAVPAVIKDVDHNSRTVHLRDPLDRNLPRGTAVSGGGFRLTVTCDALIEIFDNLSVSPTHARYFADVINAPDSMPYGDRPARGHSILIQVAPGLRGTGRSVPPEAVEKSGRLTGGGDGSRSSSGHLRPPGGDGVITLTARAEYADVRGSRGNNIGVRAVAFGTRAALAVAARDQRVVVENADGFAVGDDLILRTPDTALSETAKIGGLLPDNGIILASPLSNAFPVGAIVSVDKRFSLLVFRGDDPEPIETHRNLSVADGPRFFVGQLEQASRLLRGAASKAAEEGGNVAEVSLSGGRDPGDMEVGWYTGYQGEAYFAPAGGTPGERYGLATLEAIGEIDLVAVPDLASQSGTPPASGSADDEPYVLALRHVLHHAATCGDRLALLDAPAGTDPGRVISIAQRLADNDTARFGALYYPWLRLGDRGPGRTVPPSGFVAGVIAQADQFGGVNRAPANYPLNDVVDLEILLDGTEQDPLNRAGVNCIRRFERPVMELWGARTLSSDPASRYVNVRRLVIAVKKLLGNSLQWSVFEPNGPALWARIRTALQSQMQTLVLGGATAAGGSGSFFVQCDAETNPRETSEAGQVIARVGIAPTEPAEFIFLNVTRAQGSVSVTEAG